MGDAEVELGGLFGVVGGVEQEGHDAGALGFRGVFGEELGGGLHRAHLLRHGCGDPLVERDAILPGEALRCLFEGVGELEGQGRIRHVRTFLEAFDKLCSEVYSLIDQDTVGKVADATGEVARTTRAALNLAADFGAILKGYVSEKVGILEDRVRFTRWERRLALIDKAQAVMRRRGISVPTRELPLPFVIPLLNHAILEEDDELQETWAKLLVNAGDASTEMELRTAYVEILAGMSGFDVKNLSAMAKATLTAPSGTPRAILTSRLPQLSEPYPGFCK
jgi:hypothetical protein